jgi:DNA primase
MRVSPITATPNKQINRLEKELLQVLIQQPGSFETSQLRRILAADLVSQELRPMISAALDADESEVAAGFANYLISNLPEELHGLIRELALAELPVKNQEELSRYCAGIVSAAMLQTLNREKSDLLAALKRLDSASQAEQISAVQRQLVELETERRKLMR